MLGDGHMPDEQRILELEYDLKVYQELLDYQDKLVRDLYDSLDIGGTDSFLRMIVAIEGHINFQENRYATVTETIKQYWMDAFIPENHALKEFPGWLMMLVDLYLYEKDDPTVYEYWLKDQEE